MIGEDQRSINAACRDAERATAGHLDFHHIKAAIACSSRVRDLDAAGGNSEVRLAAPVARHGERVASTRNIGGFLDQGVPVEDLAGVLQHRTACRGQGLFLPNRNVGIFDVGRRLAAGDPKQSRSGDGNKAPTAPCGREGEHESNATGFQRGPLST